MASNMHICQDLLMEITSKLPVKSLIRFKSINQTIKSLTNTKKFAAKHFYNSTILAAQNHPTFLTIELVDESFMMTLVSKELDEQPPNSQPSPPIDVTPTLPFPENHVDTIIAHGPSAGTFCLEVTVTGFPDRLILWNPATSKINIIPLPPAVENSDWDYCSVVHGFYFDPSTTDYKVVNVLIGHGGENKPYAQVFSLRENSWRKIDITFSPSAINSSMYSSLMNGTYHWLVKTRDTKSILCFDMQTEIFSTLDLPEDSESNEYLQLVATNLAVISNKLAYVKEYSMRTTQWRNRIDIWIMNDYGIQESWTKRFVIGPSPTRWKFWECWNDGEVVLGELGDGPLVLYNIGMNQEVRETPINFGRKVHVFKYVESIYPVSFQIEDEGA